MALSAERKKRMQEVFGVTPKASKTQVTWGIPEVDLSQVSAFAEKTAGVTTLSTTVEPKPIIPEIPEIEAPKEPEVRWGLFGRDPFAIPPRTDTAVTTPMETDYSMKESLKGTATTVGIIAREFVKDWAVVGQKGAQVLGLAETGEIDPDTFLLPIFGDKEKAKKYGNTLLGTEKFTLTSRDKEFWEGIGLGGIETGGVLTTLFVLADVIPGGQTIGVFEAFAKASRNISRTDDIRVVERELRTLGLSEDVISTYAQRLVNLNDDVEVGRVVKEAVEESVRGAAGLPSKIRLVDDLNPGEEIIRTGRYFDSRPVDSFPTKALVRNLSETSQQALRAVPQELVRPQIESLRREEVLDPIEVVQTANGLTVTEGIERLAAAFRLNQPIDVVENIPSAARPQKLLGDTAVPPIKQTDPTKVPKSRALGASISAMAARARRIAREAFEPLERRIKQQEGADQILNRMRMQDDIAWSRFQRTGDSTYLRDQLGDIFQDNAIEFMRRIGFDKFSDIRLSIKELGISKHGQFDFEAKIISLATYALRNGNLTSNTMVHELWHTLSRYLPEDKLKLLEGEYAFALRRYRQENSWFNFLYSRAKNQKFGGAKFVDEDIIISPGLKKQFENRFKGKAEFIKTKAGNFKLRWGVETYRFKNIDEFFAEELTDRSFARYVKPEAQKLIDKIKALFWKVIDSFRAAFGKPRRGAVSDRLYEDFLDRKYNTPVRDGPLGEGDTVVSKEAMPEEPKVPRVRQMKTSREIPSLEKAAEQAGAFPEQQRPFTAPEPNKLTPKQREAVKTQTLNSVMAKSKGYTDKMIVRLEKAGYTKAEIAKIELPTGHKLVDVVKFKREKTGAISSVITKQRIKDIEDSFTIPKAERWTKVSPLSKAKKLVTGAARMYEVPQLFFERLGLKSQIYDVVRRQERASEKRKVTKMVRKFEEAGLFKRGGWFTADRFLISNKEANDIGKYMLARQGKGYDVTFDQLSEKAQKVVRIFDEIIQENKADFYKVATLNGKEPGDIPNYAPILTKADWEIIDQGGELNYIQRKHPGFFSLKERVPDVPVELYETDYRNVMIAWMEGASRFIEMGKVAPDIKYLLDSEDFGEIVGRDIQTAAQNWLQNSLTRKIPETVPQQTVETSMRIGRRLASVGALGLNYASVIKQSLSLVPVMFIAKARPKLRSKFAKDFGIDVKDIPSITERKGALAISDMQGKIGRIFTGALTEFDRKNAQIALNGLLDKEYKKIADSLEGVPLSPAMQKQVLKNAQDTLDMWFGGMTRSQLPPAFRSEMGRFFNMFILPLTSQLNGFYRRMAQAQGYRGNVIAGAEVAATATTIAYLEQVITNLSYNWGDDNEMRKDVLTSLLGNIPVVSQIAWSISTRQDMQLSPVLSGPSNLTKTIYDVQAGRDDKVDLGFSVLELIGLPRSVERTWEGVQILQEGGLRDKNGKLLVPVESTPEKIRAMLRGKYGPLAANDYFNNIGKRAEDRTWNVPEVEFLQNGDWARRMELVDEIGYENTLDLVAEMGSGSQEDFWRYIFAKENPDADKYELGEYLEEHGLDKDGKASKTQLEAHQKRVREIQGLETTTSITDDRHSRMKELLK